MNIYVGKLPSSATQEQLKTLFETYGEVASTRVIKDRFTGEARGFGFVEMPSSDEANAAIEALNGSDFEGQTLIVNEARERTDRPAGGSSSSYGRREGGGRPFGGSSGGPRKPRFGGNGGGGGGGSRY